MHVTIEIEEQFGVASAIARNDAGEVVCERGALTATIAVARAIQCVEQSVLPEDSLSVDFEMRGAEPVREPFLRFLSHASLHAEA